MLRDQIAEASFFCPIEDAIEAISRQIPARRANLGKPDLP